MATNFSHVLPPTWKTAVKSWLHDDVLDGIPDGGWPPTPAVPPWTGFPHIATLPLTGEPSSAPPSPPGLPGVECPAVLVNIVAAALQPSAEPLLQCPVAEEEVLLPTPWFLLGCFLVASVLLSCFWCVNHNVLLGCFWCVSHKAHNALMHALHGNGIPSRKIGGERCPAERVCTYAEDLSRPTPPHHVEPQPTPVPRAASHAAQAGAHQTIAQRLSRLPRNTRGTAPEKDSRAAAEELVRSLGHVSSRLRDRGTAMPS